MQSKATTVDAYLDEVPKDRLEALLRLRALCRKVLSTHEETMAYGMPAYQRAGKVEVSFASQKGSINLYILDKDALDKHRARLEGLSVGKGCIRFSRPERMDFALIRELLEATVASADGPC